MTFVLLFAAVACEFSFGGPSDAEETLQAIYVQQTMDANQQLAEAEPQEAADEVPTPTIEIVHTITPGQPGWVNQWWMETDSSSTAGQKRANGGDFFNQNLLERPFTAQQMEYRPDVDIVRVEISQDDNFYYFLIHLSGLNPANNMLSATYGVEIDLNRDGRGDFLVWALGDGSTDWDIKEVYVYKDDNKDVGGARPLLTDAPGYSGNSYENAIFSPQKLSDPDMAWKRVDPSDSSVMQLALKKSVINNATTFMWNGWADDGLKDPTQFDYNDFYTLSQAGSPVGGTSDYPLKDLFLTDNTCRLPYGFEATGNEPGVCYVPDPTPEPTQPSTSPCDCDSYENFTFIDDPECCEICGYVWTGNPEFPCDLPGQPPPCNCGDYPNQTFIEDEACCEYCGYNWSGSDEFPCY